MNKYNDSRGFPTIGYGLLVERNENISDTITESQADSLFEKVATLPLSSASIIVEPMISESSSIRNKDVKTMDLPSKFMDS